MLPARYEDDDDIIKLKFIFYKLLLLSHIEKRKLSYIPEVESANYLPCIKISFNRL